MGQLDDFCREVAPLKVRVSRVGVAVFNASWPGSDLRASRSYWFQFASNGDLIDSDVPQQDDGEAAAALSRDAQEWMNRREAFRQDDE